MFFKKDRKKIFWGWFEKHRFQIEKSMDLERTDHKLFDELTNKLQDFNSLLFPELTKKDDNKYVIIITANGKSKGIKPTIEIAEAAPEIENWEILRFRQPNDKVKLSLNGIAYNSNEIAIIPVQDHNDIYKYNLTIFIRNIYKDEKKYKSLAFLYLQHIIGEFNTMTRVGRISYEDLEPAENMEDLISLLEFRKLIEEQIAQEEMD
jgi:hypothetical protein